jgi:hypothetical protein
MKFSPAQKICAIVLSAVSMFALVGLIPSPQVSGATQTTTSISVSVTTTSTTHVVPVSALPKWYAPIFALGPRAKAFFTCVINVESRSTWTKPNTHDGDPAYPGQYGLYQFTWPSQNNAWDAYVYPKLHIEPRYASAYEQSEGAAILWKLGPGEVENTWSHSDHCVVPR